MSNVRWAIKEVQFGTWAVYKYGKVVKLYDSKEKAQEELARCAEDDQWNAVNRD